MRGRQHQNLELFDAYQRQIAACDAAIEAHVHTLAAHAPVPAASLPAPRTKRKPRDNEPRFEIRTPLHQLTGADLTQIDAIGPYSALRLLGEIGTDMSRCPPRSTSPPGSPWRPTTKCPAADSSARRRSRPPTAAGILRVGAMNLGCTGGLLSTLGLAGGQGQSHHRHRPQARDPRAPHVQRRAALPEPRSRRLTHETR